MLSPNSLPWAANVVSPCLPAYRKVGNLANCRVALVGAAQADDKAIRTVIGGCAHELPVAVIIVTDQ